MVINLYQYTFEFMSGQLAQALGSNFSIASIGYWFALSIAPFAYGALGASVRLLRVSELKLRERSFDPRRVPEHKNRLVLGTLSGGVIVLLYSTGGVGETGVKLTEVALGFIAGYSIDILFSILDGLVRALTPGKDKNPAPVARSNPIARKRVAQQADAAVPLKEILENTSFSEVTRVTSAAKPARQSSRHSLSEPT